MLSLKLSSVETLQEMPSGRALRSYRNTVHRHRLRTLQNHIEDSAARERETEPGAALRARCGEEKSDTHFVLALNS